MFYLPSTIVALSLLGAPTDTVLLDFYADWCGPCRNMSPVIDQLAAKGYPVRRVNVDREPGLAAQYRANMLPCFVMVAGGREVDRVVGGTTLARLEQMCLMGRQALAGAAAAQPSNPVQPVSLVTPAANPPLQAGSGPAAAENALLAATVRLRIEDPSGQSCGSGTIVDARDGEALILTCGHIFRDCQGKGRILVDLFGPSPSQAEGRMICYDLDRDIALLSIHIDQPVTVARIAPSGYRIAQGDPVANVGCNNGDPPSVRRSRVTAIDKFLGPPNIEVGGLPVQGRSGGGLFSQDGLVIGVCNAADPQDNEGYYAALASIQAKLDELQLSFVYRGNGAPAAEPSPMVAVNPPAMPRQMPKAPDTLQLTGDQMSSVPAPLVPLTATPSQTINGEERAALEELARRSADGAEVICIIRSKTNPSAKSEILVLDRVSPGFLAQLGGGTGDAAATRLPPPPLEPAVGASFVSQPAAPSGVTLPWQAPSANGATVLR